MTKAIILAAGLLSGCVAFAEPMINGLDCPPMTKPRTVLITWIPSTDPNQECNGETFVDGGCTTCYDLSQCVLVMNDPQNIRSDVAAHELGHAFGCKDKL